MASTLFLCNNKDLHKFNTLLSFIWLIYFSLLLQFITPHSGWSWQLSTTNAMRHFHCSGAWPIYSRIKSTGNLNIDLSILLWRDEFVLICLSYNMYVRYFFHCVFYVGFLRLVKKAHLKELWSCLIVQAFKNGV